LEADLAERAAPQLDHALAQRLPVDQEDLDRGAIEAPGAEVLLADRVQIEQALEVEIVHREARPARDRGPAVGRGGAVGQALDHQVPVVVGEAQDQAIGAGELPAGGQRRDLLLEMRRERGGGRLHSRSSTIGIAAQS
jgi:hypothetical protein